MHAVYNYSGFIDLVSDTAPSQMPASTRPGNVQDRYINDRPDCPGEEVNGPPSENAT